jgi:hypothetical protein
VTSAYVGAWSLNLCWFWSRAFILWCGLCCQHFMADVLVYGHPPPSSGGSAGSKPIHPPYSLQHVLLNVGTLPPTAQCARFKSHIPGYYWLTSNTNTD